MALSLYPYMHVIVYMWYIPGHRDIFAVTDLGEYLINLRKTDKLFFCEQGAKSGKQNRRKNLEQENIDLMK